MWTTDLGRDEQILINTGTEEYTLTPTVGSSDFLYHSSRGMSTLTLSAKEPTILPGPVEASMSYRQARSGRHVRIVLKAPKSVSFLKRPCPTGNSPDTV
jgi:hypothetical protein